MSTQTITPGPWNAVKVGESSGYDLYEVESVPDRSTVAEMMYAEDARLIAAAPELLAACKELLDSLHIECCREHSRGYARLTDEQFNEHPKTKEYRALIAKAEGRND